MGGPWWLYLVGVYTGADMAVDFARHTVGSEGWQQVGNAAGALAGVFVVLGSLYVAVVKRRQSRAGGT
jgi:hypothetical protein